MYESNSNYTDSTFNHNIHLTTVLSIPFKSSALKKYQITFNLHIRQSL